MGYWRDTSRQSFRLFWEGEHEWKGGWRWECGGGGGGGGEEEGGGAWCNRPLSVK